MSLEPFQPRRAEEHSAWGHGGLFTSLLLCSQGQAGTGPPMPAFSLTSQLSMGDWGHDLGDSHVVESTLWAGGLLC